LNKQVISYVSKLFPTGITYYICMLVDGHFNPDDGKQPETFGLNFLILQLNFLILRLNFLTF